MSAVLSGRSRKVLGRFPRHMEADTPGKLIGSVAQALVRDQDVQAADIQGIRNAHRLREARELIDLLQLGALHGISRAEMSLLFARYNKACNLLKELETSVEENGDLVARHKLVADLFKLWSIPGEEPLKLFAAEPNDAVTFDARLAVDSLISSATDACRSKVLLEGVRSTIAETAAIHVIGNGTIQALMRGAANILDLELVRFNKQSEKFERGIDIESSEDRFWHASLVRDRMRIHQASVNGSGANQPIDPKIEYMGFEENPKALAERGPRPSKHAEPFHYLRKGFGDALLEIRVTGVGERTISPMVVSRDSGHGVGFFGRVPDGKELVFSQGGRALLDGLDVTSRAYAWQGACFAADAEDLIDGNGTNSAESNDFRFADELLSAAEHDANPATSRFVVVSPAATLNREARLPHAGENLPMPSIGVGKTRFTFFVQQGHYSTKKSPAEPLTAMVFGQDLFASTPDDVLNQIELVPPRYGVAFTDASVFADVPGTEGEVSGKVHLSWWERQAYCVKLLIPRRFRMFDDVQGASVIEQIKKSIRRFRPAGIHIDVDFVTDQWVLGESELPLEDEAMTSPLSRIRSRTTLVPSEEPG